MNQTQNSRLPSVCVCIMDPPNLISSANPRKLWSTAQSGVRKKNDGAESLVWIRSSLGVTLGRQDTIETGHASVAPTHCTIMCGVYIAEGPAHEALHSTQRMPSGNTTAAQHETWYLYYSRSIGIPLCTQATGECVSVCVCGVCVCVCICISTLWWLIRVS